MSAALLVEQLSPRPAQRRRSNVVAQLIADQAVLALLRELQAWPKPGLVSHVDSGSHQDMDAAMMTASAHVLRPFFAELANAGQDGADMAGLRAIGLRAEAAMLAATGGVNTHRGAIFGLACSAPRRARSARHRQRARRLRRFVSARSSRDDGPWKSGEVQFRSSVTAPLRSVAMAQAAPGPRRPGAFAASMRWACRPCGRAARCSPTTSMQRLCTRASN